MNTQRDMMEALLEGYVFKGDCGRELRLDCDGNLVYKDIFGNLQPYTGPLDNNLWELQKVEYIEINGHYVSMPIKKPLSIGEKYFHVDIVKQPFTSVFKPLVWSGSQTDYDFLDDGLIHLTLKAMLEHRDALLSFTKEK